MKRLLAVCAVLAVIAFSAFSGCKGSSGDAGAQGPAGPTLPAVTATSPALYDANVPIDAAIRITFSKDMNPATVSAANITVTSGGASIPGTVSYNAGSKTAYFDSTSMLPAFSHVAISVSPGVTDAAGNALISYSWSFSTGGSFAPSRLYVVNGGGNNTLVFNNAGGANGDVFADRIISSETLTTVSIPWGLWLDKASDQLYVASNGSNNVVVYNNAGSVTGTVQPVRIISSSSSTIWGDNGLWLDSANNRLYVTGYFSKNIVVYENASTANGDTNPSRIISGGTTTIGAQGLWLDAVNDRLYVTDWDHRSVVVYNNASTVNGSVEPTRIISSATMTYPDQLWLDTASDSLYVASCGGIFVFNNASSANGATVPARVITSSGALSCARGVWLDAATDRLYVSGVSGVNSTILVFNNGSTTNGDTLPSRAVSSVNSTLNVPRHIWLDTGY